MIKTKKPNTKKKYSQAWEKASEQLQSHSLTHQLSESELQKWTTLAEHLAQQYHRSSSAVEGRNGCLSQMYHNGQGFTEKRLRALTVIHNYFIKRVDGTTAAMRLFGNKHPDIFEWLHNQMGELPLPRKPRGHTIAKSLKLLNVPS